MIPVSLDLVTLLIVTTMNVLLAGVALYLVSSLNTGAEGIRRCLAGTGLIVAGLAFITLRPSLPPIPGIILTNVPLFAAALLLVDGVSAFRGIRERRTVYIALIAAYVLAFGWFTVVRDDPNARTIVENFLVAAIALWAAGIMGWKVSLRDRTVYWFTAGGFALHAFSLLGRVAVAVFGKPFIVLQARPIDYVNLATLNMSAVGCAMGLSIATNLRLQRDAETLARYDPLTGLPNRRFFEERLERAGRTAGETGERLALIYCDLDDLKGINDSLGHQRGDQAIRIVAERLRSVVSPDVCLARIGGDEFVLLVEGAPPSEGVQSMAERLTKSAAGTAQFDGVSINLRVSCGCAVYPDEATSVSDLIRVADASMYLVKRGSRRRVYKAG